MNQTTAKEIVNALKSQGIDCDVTHHKLSGRLEINMYGNGKISSISRPEIHLIRKAILEIDESIRKVEGVLQYFSIKYLENFEPKAERVLPARYSPRKNKKEVCQ